MKIAVLDDYQGVAKTFADWRALEGTQDVHVFREHIAGGRDAVVAALQDFDVIAAMRERTVFDRATLEQLPNLKFMVTTGMRNSSIDMAYLNERGIACSGTAGRTQTTPELAWGLILAVARNIPLEDGNMRAGRWQQTIGLDLEDKTLGIVGLGRLGREMARIGQAFKMNVIAWSQNLTEAGAAEVGVRRVEKGALFAEADVVTVHYKHSERSTGLLGAAEFAAMKPTGIFVNTSRAAIIDMAALMETLQAGRIAGAGLDVYDDEPVPVDHPIRSCPRTVLTPHLGYVSHDTYRLFYAQTVENIEAWLAGAPVRVIDG
ncbi:MAG: D-2-hydroxyacid dehydrogenase family protein [Hyphomicrobiaceae bacterium]